MSRNFNPLDFIRHAPDALLRVYFESREVSLEIDRDDGPTADQIFDAVNTLSETERVSVLADFRELQQRSRDGGFVRAIIDEARFHKIDPDLSERFQSMKNALEKVFWIFLYRKEEYWDGANIIWRVDKLTKANSWTSRAGLPARPGAVDEAMVKGLSTDLIGHFRAKEGRGRRCKVEAYRRGAEEIFYAYPEDYGTTINDYTGDELRARPIRPAFEIIFRHVDAERRLDIFSTGTIADVGELQVLFARAILGEEIDADYDASPPVYDLDRLLDPEFDFEWPEDSGIRSVLVKVFRVLLETEDFQRITVEADPNHRNRAAYELLTSTTSGVPDTIRTVDHAVLSVTFDKGPNDKRTPTRSVQITSPHTCRMNHDERGEQIHRMLKQSRIELTDAKVGTDVAI